MTATPHLAVLPAGTSGPRAGRLWVALIVLLGGQFMALLDVTIVNVAMPSIGADLHASGAALQLVVAGYTVAYAMLLITGARLGALYGRRRLFLAGVAAFTASSLACGLAPDIAALVAARFLQVGAAAEVVLGLDLRSGTHGGVALPLILLVLGAGLGVAYSPLVTYALAKVPPADAADASGLHAVECGLAARRQIRSGEGGRAAPRRACPPSHRDISWWCRYPSNPARRTDDHGTRCARQRRRSGLCRRTAA